MATEQYTLEQAEDDIAALTGAHNVIGEAMTQTDVTDPPTNPSSGAIGYSKTGQAKYASSDGQDYNTGRNTSDAPSSLTLSTSFQTYASVPLGVGDYRICGQLFINPTVGGSTMTYQFTGSGGLAQSNMRIAITEAASNASNSLADWATSLGANVGPGTSLGTANRVVRVDGRITVSTGGTLNLQAKFTAAGATATAPSFGGYLEALPIT